MTVTIEEYTSKRDRQGSSTATTHRGEAKFIQENGVPEGGSTATIERGRAKAIQVNGGPEGGSTATIK